MPLNNILQSKPKPFVYDHTPEPAPFLEQDPADKDGYKRPLFFSDMSPMGFSAIDINAYIHPPAGLGLPGPLKFGTLSMLSVSTHRDKFPVAALAKIGPKGYTYGHRTIGGTMVFNTIHRDAFEQLLNSSAWSRDLHPDELPPFDIQIVMCNDAGEMSICSLIGLTILDSGSTFSLEQISLSSTYSYMAMDITAFTSVLGRTPPKVINTDPYLADVPRGMNWGSPTIG